MYNKWDNKCHEYDSKNPTFSSSLLDKINKSLKNNPKNDFDENLSFFRATKDAKKIEDEKMSSLRRACLVEKWMEKKVTEKVSKKSKVKSCKTLLEEFDVQDTLFFGTTSTSSSSSEEFPINYTHPRQQKPRMTCFAAPPPMPKSVRTRPIESKFIENLDEKSSSRSRAVKMYSNLKNLKQPISPGVRLTSFINSLFAKDNDNKKNSKKNNKKDKISSNIIVPKSEKIKPTSYSACTTPTSYSRSCFSNNKEKKFQDDGIKRTVRFCPVSVILDEESRPCGQKPVFEDGFDRISSSNFGRSLSKRYEELKILNGLERDNNTRNDSNSNSNSNMKLEKVALDLLSGYCWDTKLSSKSDDECSKDKVNDGNYGGNYGVNCGQREDNYDYDDGLSCSSSDLFELDHLSLIGDELPVYETTQFDPKLH
ncbi:protein BIG GRAIN 1-like B [Silene latifolia]|uniref:protein BIG GRAIN 1-like B n=1 Tax=Silene latifolia TaxID=37657 RepID=UPI003D774DE2